MESTPKTSARPLSIRRWLPTGLLIFGIFGILLRLLCASVNLDPDLFHEMSLARVALQEGHIPMHDVFAYTPTVYPVVHHEWGSGFIFYFLMKYAGPEGLRALSFILIAGTLVCLAAVARQRGAAWFLMLLAFIPAVGLLAIGFSTVRAQLFTMFFTSLLLLILSAAETRSTRWLLAWPPLHLLWLNLHAGFVTGVGILLLYGIERSIRARRIAWPFLITFAICVALIPVNPYGFSYPPFLYRSLTMARPLITEWHPLWTAPQFLWVYILTLVLTFYAVFRLGIRSMPQLVILVIAAVLALWHVRHAALYAMIWMAFMPGYLQRTPLGALVQDVWRRWRYPLAGMYALVGLVGFVWAVPDRPWIARLPATHEDEQAGSHIIYPRGAAEFLQSHHVRGNILAPFEVGAYLSWELYPNIKVAIDGRYEVAYPPEFVGVIRGFYIAGPQWQDVLTRYPPDLVLIPAGRPICAPFARLPGWTQIYSDPEYIMYGRAGFAVHGLPHP